MEQEWGGGACQEGMGGCGCWEQALGSRDHLIVARGRAGSWVCSGARRAGSGVDEQGSGEVWMCPHRGMCACVCVCALHWA